MKIVIKYILLIIILLNFKNLYSQQSSLFNTYSIDPLLLNIAYSGSSCREVNLHYRTQWIGMAEAPKSMQLNAHTPFGKTTGIGIRINSQSVGLLDKLSVILGYSYSLKISKYSKVLFGIGLGWDQSKFNTNKAIVLSNRDANLNNFNQQNANGIDSEFGLLLDSKKSKLGLSVLHLFNSNPDFSGNGTLKTLPQINLQGSYLFNKNKNIEIEPFLLNRYTLRGNNVIEGIVNFNIEKMLTLGLGYRSNYGFVFLANFKIENFKIAYSIDYGVSKNATNLGTSHQIMLGYSLCKIQNSFSLKRKSVNINDKVSNEQNIKHDSVELFVNTSVIENNLDTIVLSDPAENPIKNNKEIIVDLDQEKGSLAKNQDSIIETIEEKASDIVKLTDETVKISTKKDELKSELEVYKKQLIVNKINTISEEIIFGLNESKLNSEILKKLDEIAQIIKSNPSLKINIIGHTCNIGTDEYNKLLSIRRANYVRQELQKRGVKKENFNRTIGKGKNEALFENNSNNLNKNRTIRVELVK